jgi:hypothetical protein
MTASIAPELHPHLSDIGYEMADRLRSGWGILLERRPDQGLLALLVRFCQRLRGFSVDAIDSRTAEFAASGRIRDQPKALQVWPVRRRAIALAAVRTPQEFPPCMFF